MLSKTLKSYGKLWNLYLQGTIVPRRDQDPHNKGQVKNWNKLPDNLSKASAFPHPHYRIVAMLQ